jgi:CheY-like chemotaxis protein
VRELLREVLEADGYSVLLTSGGEEALQLCRSYKKEIHLMLTDVVMPGMNGRELGESAAALRPEMKVLYMSGYTDEAIIHHGVLDAGVAFLEAVYARFGCAQSA